MHMEGGTRGKCHRGSHPGSIYVGGEMQVDSSQDRDLGLQNLAGRDAHGWEDTVATCVGGSPGGTQLRQMAGGSTVFREEGSL